MCKGISISEARLGQELLERFELAGRVRVRDNQAELQFMYTDPVVQLPVVHAGRMTIYEWGNRGNKESRLPRTGWCRSESLAAGKWKWLKPQTVEIPADSGLEKSVWFPIERGLEGVVVLDEQQQPHVYMLTQPASDPYQALTRHDRMPVLIDQSI